MSTETDTTSEVARVLRGHRIECTGLEGVTCRGCRELGWMSWLVYYGHQAAALAEAGLLRAQIATQEPAGAPVAPPEGVGTSGTLSGRLRAEAEAGRVGQHARLSAIAAEVERTEQARDLYRADANGMLQQKDQWRDAANTAEAEVARLRAVQTEDYAGIAKMANSYAELQAQVERVRALTQWFRGQGQTGYARKVEEALDGTAPEPVSENPFRMPEDRAPATDWSKVDHTADQCQFEECPSCGCCAHGKEHVIGCSTTLDRPLGTECPNSDCACKGGMG
jgi:Rad3-related DNA helicase